MTGWCALVPQKALAGAKGRLELQPQQRRAVATAMLRDTVAALASTPAVHRIVVLWDDPADRSVLPTVAALSTQGRGLNESLQMGAEAARSQFPGLGVLVVPGDLPALDPAELALCLERAARVPRAYLPDAAATGTTILTANRGCSLLPAYGGTSAAAHAATGAYSLSVSGLDSLRADVDDLESLTRALALGCGHHTTTSCVSQGLVPQVVR